MKSTAGSWGLFAFSLLVLLVFTAGLSLSVGSADIRFFDIPGIIAAGPGTPEYGILMGIRLPRTLLGIATGGALSLAGTLLQGMFKNPLVEPYTLGISGGASLGVCMNILFRLYAVMGMIAYPLSGFAGASLVIFLVYGLNRSTRHIRSNRMLLTGVMISYVASSLVMLLMALARSDDLQTIVLWIMGSLDEPDMTLICMAVTGSLAGLFLSYFFCLDLNGLALGEEEAENLGVNTSRARKGIFFIASFLTGLSVSMTGVIMFVGLVVPHFMRLVTGPDHRILLPATYLAGGIFLLVCDVVARTVIAPMELPVGVITGIIGGVVFIRSIAGKKEAL
ncbi:iron ABC transporter permease [uncultured Desulfobacter sp.]|uniref:FecCD family ABC transporter permease n=1 Tax=uncultured Desulfobacter sp. TaxID=240139 RepID=UPI002AAC26BF|nr:iron ABC transporter permease [uncultured Desulfobacter sp.]